MSIFISDVSENFSQLTFLSLKSDMNLYMYIKYVIYKTMKWVLSVNLIKYCIFDRFIKGIVLLH